MKSNIIILGIFAVFLVGCSSVEPTAKEYILSPKTEVAQTQQSRFADAVVRVAQPYGPESLFSQNMYYVEDNLQQYYYSASQWAESPKSMITQKILQMLRETKVFGFVLSPASKVATEYLLETRVDNFKQYFQKRDRESYVIVSITFTLSNARKHTVVMSKTFHVKQEVTQLNAEGGVKALNEALKRVLDEAAVWIIEESK